MGEWFSFRSISAWVFSHRTDINSNGKDKSLTFFYKYSLAIFSDCYSHLTSIHSVYFQISAVWGLTLIYRRWTHSLNAEHAPLHRSFVVNTSPAPRERSVESGRQGCSAHPLSDDTWGRDANRFWKHRSVDWCHKEFMGLWKRREGLGWKCEWGIPNTYLVLCSQEWCLQKCFCWLCSADISILFLAQRCISCVTLEKTSQIKLLPYWSWLWNIHWFHCVIL